MGQESDISSLTFEDALKRLEGIVQRLESGDAALDESIDLYARGDALRAQCEARLASAQTRIDTVTMGRDGQPAGVQPFDVA